MNLVISKTENTKKLYLNSKPTIVLMTKWHAIFRCKSRLAKDIGAYKAAKIQEKLTNHTINVAKEIQKEGLADIKLQSMELGLRPQKNGPY